MMRTSLRMRHVGVFTAAIALSSCSFSKDESGRDEPSVRQEGNRDQTVTPSAKSNLQWKRYGAFEADLARALALSPETMCLEFGKEPCIRKVHLVPLGGHEPFATGMLEAPADVLATTPTVVDRVVLSACTNSVEADRAAGASAKVFKGFSLSGDAPEPSAAPTRALVTDLYRRLLARDPLDSELQAVAALAREDEKAIPAADFAKLACFTIGTTTEFLFF